jgi:hypothetical protein
MRGITETTRTQLALFGMLYWAFGPCLWTNSRLLTSVSQTPPLQVKTTTAAATARLREQNWRWWVVGDSQARYIVWTIVVGMGASLGIAVGLPVPRSVHGALRTPGGGRRGASVIMMLFEPARHAFVRKAREWASRAFGASPLRTRQVS